MQYVDQLRILNLIVNEQTASVDNSLITFILRILIDNSHDRLIFYPGNTINLLLQLKKAS